MTTKHTPGPWHLEELGRSGSANTVCASSGDIIAEVNPDDNWTPERRWDARLIAAAPDLLVACCMASAAFEAYATGHRLKGDVEKAARNQELWDLLDAAIAKAEGRDP